MTTQVDDIVKVTITRESSAVSRAGFQTPLFVSEHSIEPSTGQRTILFTGGDPLEDLVAAGFGSDTVAYKQLAAALAQEPRLSTFVIGRKIPGAGETWTQAMDNISAQDGESWYGFTASTRDKDEVKELADWAELKSHIYFAHSLDAELLDVNSADNVAKTLNELAYKRTALFARQFSAQPEDEQYLECRALARILAADLDITGGHTDLAHKTLPGASPNRWTGSERTVLHSLNCNTYERRNSKNITFPGNMVGGTPVDETIAIDWLDARMTEDIFALLTGTPTKVPYSSAGIAAIEGAIRVRLEKAVASGILNSYEVSVPTYEAIAKSDKEARKLRDVRFTAILAGSIRTVQIDGTVSV